MATKPADQQRMILMSIGLLVAAIAVVGLRSIRSGREIAARPLPIADLQSISSFLGPLPTMTVLAHDSTGTMVVARDPFAPSGVAGSRTPSSATNPLRPTTAAGRHWVVSSILFEGTEKSAIVNNAWVTIGDSLGGGSRLTAIEADHIVVTDAKGVRHTVRIQGGELW
jgi:hypothetical protein